MAKKADINLIEQKNALLKQAIEEYLQSPDRAKLESLSKTLYPSVFLVPGFYSDTADGNRKYTFSSVSFAKGKTNLLVFTDREEMNKLKSQPKEFMCISFLNLIAIAEKDENMGMIVINAKGKRFILPEEAIHKIYLMVENKMKMRS